MKIKEIDKRYMDAEEKLSKMIAEQEQAVRSAEEFNAGAEESAIAGDLERYKELKAKANDAEAFVYVHQKQIDRMKASPAVTKEETVDAWLDFVKGYNKDLKAKMEKFEDAKRKMLKEYAEMIDMQNEACSIRERLGSYIGKCKEPARIDGGLGDLYPMEYIPYTRMNSSINERRLSTMGINIHDPEAVYYLVSATPKGELIGDTVQGKTILNVLEWRVSR